VGWIDEEVIFVVKNVAKLDGVKEFWVEFCELEIEEAEIEEVIVDE